VFTQGTKAVHSSDKGRSLKAEYIRQLGDEIYTSVPNISFR